MDINEIKKFLYKENPTANLWQVRKDGIVYTSAYNEMTLLFLVPLEEIGEVVWDEKMPAKLLIRYLQNVALGS
jgi:hypothetical protein